jgi:hypothetical protein
VSSPALLQMVNPSSLRVELSSDSDGNHIAPIYARLSALLSTGKLLAGSPESRRTGPGCGGATDTDFNEVSASSAMIHRTEVSLQPQKRGWLLIDG